MSDFDEKRGCIACKTDWGEWWQNIDEVVLLISTPEEIKAKDIRCTVKTKQLKITVSNQIFIEGELTEPVHAEETIWTLEDHKVVRVVLLKCNKTSANCWRSLLVGQYEADPWTFDQWERQLTLNRLDDENPGLDFSGAEISGNYHGGGPKLPT